MRTRGPRFGAVLAVLAGCTALCCSLLTTFDEGKLTEDTFERCRDRTDNDGNGLADCDDPACAVFGICRELTAESCSDDVDNDSDKLVDCQDPGCAALPGVCIEKTAQACSDGKDNDNDGLADCKDVDCQTLDVCQEVSDADCTDGVDNDKDGLVDCNDFECYQQPTCCTIKTSVFTGDTFSYQASCSVHQCTETEPTCCQSGYELCNSFDPAKWIAWGLPRPIQQDNAFVSNEPCGCESSGIASVESVTLHTGTIVTFNLSLADTSSSVCAGLTRTTTFVDDYKQCAGVPKPQLLVGICLEGVPESAPRLSAVVDGAIQQQVTTAISGSVSATLEIRDDGVDLSAPPLSYQTTPLDKALATALVLVYGAGTGGVLDGLVVKDPSRPAMRCRSPGSWYRHLARGEPVINAPAEDLAFASHPTVIYEPESKSYLMLFVGKGAWPGLFAAKSTDGTQWKVSSDPVLPTSATDTSFGTSQGSPSLLYFNGSYHVWYTREDETGSFVQRAIAHATSPDGVTWKPSPGVAGQHNVLGPGQALSWDSRAVADPSVVPAPTGGLLMWYTGTRTGAGSLPSIGVAGSKEGTSWTRLQAHPIVAPTPDSAELACEDPAVVYDPVSKLYMMWYTQRTFGQPASIRHAVSANGLAWTVWPAGAVLTAGPLGTFDARGVEAPTALLEGDRIKLWYTGTNDKGLLHIGYAENRGGL